MSRAQSGRKESARATINRADASVLQRHFGKRAAWLPNLAGPEEILPDAITKLRQWDEKLEISDWEAAAEAKKPKKAAAAH